MALELRPNCEYCDRDLPPASAEARICSYECTFCADCVATRLRNVCPNCGGGFMPRPIRPRVARRPGVGLDHQPASTQRRVLKHPAEDVERFVAQVAGIAAQDR
ncbi:MAG: DUF1272 domain-containing protein [Burkholderiaceae bacterium]